MNSVVSLILKGYNMHARKQLAHVIEQVLEQDQDTDIDQSTVEDYKKLNDKCDIVIGKIKGRKGKKTEQQVGE
jgi:hypothetical protein